MGQESSTLLVLQAYSQGLNASSKTLLYNFSLGKGLGRGSVLETEAPAVPDSIIGVPVRPKGTRM